MCILIIINIYIYFLIAKKSIAVTGNGGALVKINQARKIHRRPIRFDKRIR